MPLRTLTVTGTGPAASTVAATTAASRRGLTVSADPPPWRVTLRTGQPKLRSMWSTWPSSTSRRTAACMVAGSVP